VLPLRVSVRLALGYG